MNAMNNELMVNSHLYNLWQPVRRRAANIQSFSHLYKPTVHRDGNAATADEYIGRKALGCLRVCNDSDLS